MQTQETFIAWMLSVQTSAILTARRDKRSSEWAACVVARAMINMPEVSMDALTLGLTADEYVQGESDRVR